MSSAVHKLQMDIVEGKKSMTQLLRQTKLIAAKLDLKDVENWVDNELNGYSKLKDCPAYREVLTEGLVIHNPYRRGWQFVGDLKQRLKILQPIADIEVLAESDNPVMRPPTNFPITDSEGSDSGSEWPQRITFNKGEFKGILEAVRNELLKWAIELERRGIKGEDMNFDEKEKQTAANQVFNIGTVHGIVGNATNSQVNIHIANSHNELKVQVNAIREVEAALAAAIAQRKPEGEGLTKANEAEKSLRKVREELEDEKQPDPNRVLKWLEQAKYALKAFGLTKEIIEAGHKLEDAFHLSDWLGRLF